MFVDSAKALACRKAAVKGWLSVCRVRMTALQRYVDMLEAVAAPTPLQVQMAHRLAQVLADATDALVADPAWTAQAKEEEHAD